jgi:uncharacterized membrane protein HdeD (DUF308 family)
MGETCGGCTPQCHGIKILIAGLILVVNQIWQIFDVWLVVGLLVVAKGLLCMRPCPCQGSAPAKKKKG